MAIEISGSGLVITIVASNTFPVGFPVTEFADDSDPLEAGQIEIANASSGLNGDLVTFSKPTPLSITLSVIAGSDADVALSILADANRVAFGKNSANDLITLTAVYPSGLISTLTKGRLINSPSIKSVSSAGRLKSRSYTFAFENKVGA
jgi:hypothetical protein